MVRPASLLPFALLGPFLLGCKAEVPVPGKERVGTYLLQSVGDPLSNDCAPAIFDAGVDGGAMGGAFVDAGVILSVTYNQTTTPDGGTRLPDGGPVIPYDAGYLTFVEGSGSEYGVIVGQVIDVSAIASRVFSACNCTSLEPPDILVQERNVIALLSDSQARALGSLGTCAPPSVVLDGGIPPVDGGSTGPRDPNGVWSVPLVCGVTEEQVQVLNHRDGGCSLECQSCTIRFAVQGRTLQE
ncbi:MAG TPA: hypothetical protein VMT11_10505 [Myxococcaceae bacterium]|nr:hypothetical protein [Myxococcaceae bacterium]